MAEITISADAKLVWERLDETGKSKGNYALMKELGWGESPQRYWDARNKLIDSGIADTGRGKGGSVKRALNVTLVTTDGDSITITKPERDAEETALESELYQPIKRTIETNWPLFTSVQKFRVDITAYGGSRTTGGKWSRPDIAMVSYNEYEFVPVKHFEVTTFEVKKHNSIDVTAVYEAVSHLRRANNAYVVLQVPADKKDDLKDRVDEVFNVALKHGIGLIVVEDLSNFETWDIMLDAEYNDADPRELERFIRSQMALETHKEIKEWVAPRVDSPY